jgi:hypothetical protein
LHESSLTGNFDHARPDDLHRTANAFLHDYFAEGKRKQRGRYQDNAGNGLTSSDLQEVPNASVTGRVDTLFVRPDAQVRGHFDAQNLVATIHDPYQPGDTSLSEQAALLMLQNGGEVSRWRTLPDGSGARSRSGFIPLLMQSVNRHACLLISVEASCIRFSFVP